MKKNIRHNKDFKKLFDDIISFKFFLFFCWFFSWIGLLDKGKISDLRNQLMLLEKEVDILMNLPDKFNDFFSSRGWIAYESMDPEIMRRCVDLAKVKKVSEAEDFLTSYFDKENVKVKISMMGGCKEIVIRSHIINSAYEDYIAGRYYACVPVLLLIIDGIVNDVAASQKGFFVKKPDVIAWNSIAGHNKGLKSLAKLFNTSRKKTNNDPLSIPFRNGIMHGRDINYGNMIVSAKLWSCLFAISDWAKSLKRENKEEEKHSWKETIKLYEDRRLQKDMLEKWKPRILEPDIDFPLLNQSKADFAVNSPEMFFLEFLELINDHNFGNIAKSMFSFREENLGSDARRARERFKDIQILNGVIYEITDLAAARTEICIELEYKKSSKGYKEKFDVILIYSDDKGRPLVRNLSHGDWKISRFTL